MMSFKVTGPRCISAGLRRRHHHRLANETARVAPTSGPGSALSRELREPGTLAGQGLRRQKHGAWELEPREAGSGRAGGCRKEGVGC